MEQRRAETRPRERSKQQPRPHGLLDEASHALMQGRIAEACALVQTAAAGAPGSPAVWKFLGQCYMRLGQREQAVIYYRRYLELAPESPDALFIQRMIE
jgi:Flp pilus assembly protein TadD